MPLRLLIVAALAAPLLAEESGAEAYGFRRLVATPSQNGQMLEISVEGECSFPDDTTIDVFLEHRGQQCEGLVVTVTPKGGLFTARMSAIKRMLPGNYVVKAHYNPLRQEGEVVKLLQGLPEKAATQGFAIGTPEEIKKVRDEHLKIYEAELATIEETFARLAATYEKLVKKYDMRESPLEWNRLYGNVPTDCQTAIERLKAQSSEVVIPVFPLLDSWTIEGWGILSKLCSLLTDGLTIEITEAMSRKGTDRHYFLKKAKQEMANFLKGMRAQIALERKLEQRDALVGDITELSRLYEESSNTYEQAKSIGTDEVKKAWQGFMTGADGKGGWRGALKDMRKRLDGYRGGVLEAEYRELVDLLTGAPGSLEKLWDLYDGVILKGRSAEEASKSVKEALDDCYIHIYPVMEVLGFNREVFNRLMQRYQGAPEDGAPEEPVAATIGDYVLSQVQKLDAKDPSVSGKAMQVLMKLGEPAKKILKETLEKGGIENPKIVGLITICLGRLGEKSASSRIFVLLTDSPDESLRVSAAMTLGQMGGTEMVAPLVKALSDDKSPAVRAAAANALPLLREPTAIPDLLKAWMDEDLGVRQAAERGVESLAGVDFHFDAGGDEDRRRKDLEQAKSWWEENRERLLNPERKSPEKNGSDGGGK